MTDGTDVDTPLLLERSEGVFVQRGLRSENCCPSCSRHRRQGARLRGKKKSVHPPLLPMFGIGRVLGMHSPPFFVADRESFVRPHEVVNRVLPNAPKFHKQNTKPFHSPKIPVSHHDLQISKLIVRFLANFAVIASCRSLNLLV